MKEWKVTLAEQIVKAYEKHEVIALPGVGRTDRAVRFCDVARADGYKHINRDDLEDVLREVNRQRPDLSIVRLVDDPEHVRPTESRWETTYITDLELE